MDGFAVEPKMKIDGVECHFVIHDQAKLGSGPMAPAHLHDYIEMLYCLSGECAIFLNHRYYQFTAGDMVVINAREIHQIKGLSDGANRYIVVRFDPELLYTSYQSAFELRYVLPFTINDATPQKIFHAREIQDTFIPQLFHTLLQEYKAQEYGYELAIRTGICRIFLWILRYWNNMGIDLPRSTPDNEALVKQFQRVIDYMTENYAQDIDAAEMANRCDMSYSYFSRMFKKTMHKSFREYLTSIRISKAEILLTTTDLSITEIAMQTGFSSTSYFIQQFRQVKSVSPKQFQKAFLATGA